VTHTNKPYVSTGATSSIGWPRRRRPSRTRTGGRVRDRRASRQQVHPATAVGLPQTANGAVPHRALLAGLLLLRHDAKRTQLTGVIGAGPAWSRYAMATNYRTIHQRPTDPPLASIRHVDRIGSALGIVGGVDFAVPVSRRISLVPQFRVVFTPRTDEDDFEEPPTLTYHIGAGVRTRFP
jgi:hypothetical protein